MKKNEILKIILILKTSYPYAFKDMSKDEVESMVNLYEELFKENSYEEVSKAIKSIINTSEYMPAIATIKSKIYDMKHPNDENNMDLWEKLLIAIRNGSYHAEEEYEKLPTSVQKFLGSPYQLQELAVMNSDDIHTVVKGQFLKQIEIIKADCKEREITGRLILQNSKRAELTQRQIIGE